jgi:superfamily II DNA or RNA helicase
MKKNKRDSIQSEALEIGIKNKRCSLAISMGVGKTLIGLSYINHFQGGNMGMLRVLVVAPKLSIFDSWKNDAEKFNIDITNIKFTTYLSLHKETPSHYDLVVLDECHSLLYPHQTFLGMFTGRILGLTGTPPRHSNSEKGIMVNQYCPIKFKYITDEAVEDDILNDYRIIIHKMSLSNANNLLVELKDKKFYTSETRNYSYWTQRIIDASTKKQEQIASIMRMKALMGFRTKEEYTKQLLEDIEDKCIVFCNTQEQADYMCTHSYHSTNPNSEENLDMFKHGKIDKLSCVLQLNEGVNIPELRAGIIMHAYGNERKSSQRIGRLLRLNPTETAYVHILCYKNTVDERWVGEALKDFDQSKIKYFDVDDTSRKI